MKIAVGITGASGSIYAKVLLEKLSQLPKGEHTIQLVWSSNAPMVWDLELQGASRNDFAFTTFGNHDFMAPFASGSAGFDALIICPCSMGTLGRIASGISNDLITRAADVLLKERKKLICVVREAPYNLIHLKNMTAITEAGGIICPASPSFYSNPNSIDALVETIVDRVLQLAGISIDTFKWGSSDAV
jgi:4-hydroxy-3-polyprenylbenzoate decarboxylase